MANKPNVSVTVGENESIEKALRKFKKLCEKAGIKKECKSRRYYEKPSEARRREARKAERNRRKDKRKVREQESRNQKKGRSHGWMFNHPKLTD